ncbi:hypothetical protein [Azospirillum brasilense]|uniref:hypothetical protein n=1 Tax=Azospirillum brasilense TaxID=192 RepID=UPI001EDC65D3|nr:hypothetical protein [Azospirillum brasilense]UKJ74241.1 hypothetical protein H1Q64_06560 [Azospirillum brasilense]
MTARKQALRRRLEEAEFAAHELWLERFYAELRRMLMDRPQDTRQRIIVALRAFHTALGAWSPATTAADIEAGLLSAVEGAGQDAGAELRRCMASGDRGAPAPLRPERS